jgi:hypothetical protein
MIDREFIDKEIPTFKATLSVKLSQALVRLISENTEPLPYYWPPPGNWPAVLLLHGTAGLISIWEELGVDPIVPVLDAEAFLHHEVPEPDSEITGEIRILDIRESLHAGSQICDNIDMSVDFFSQAGVHIARYLCSYRIPLTIPPGISRRKKQPGKMPKRGRYR